MLIVDEIEQLYVERGAQRYEIGGAASGVTQLQHALQCARLAQHAGARIELVVAALLHDLGHLINADARAELDPHHDDVHQYIALPFLRRWFGPQVLEPIKLHVDAKRYLCAVDPGYWAGLSAGSKRSLVLQGGPFSAAQAADFIRRPHAADAVALRRWDDRAKDVNADVPGFAYWRSLLREVAATAALTPETASSRPSSR
jgi:phosphonate degradation associated HDIG domain protein